MSDFLATANEAARWCATNPWSTLALVWAVYVATKSLPAVWRLLAAIARLAAFWLALKLRMLRHRRGGRRSKDAHEDRRISVRVIGEVQR